MNNYENSGFLFPYVRFFNASPQGGSMDFYMGNTLVAAGIKFGNFTGFMKTGTGMQTYKATRAGRKDDIVAKMLLSQNVGEVKNLCIVGKADKPEFMAVTEPTQRNNPQYGHFRVCNLSPEGSGFDVYANESMILGDINYKELSNYMEILPESYEISLWKDKKKVLNCGMHTMKQSRFNTLYIIGLTDEIPHLSGVFSVDAASYGGFYL